MLEPLWKQLGRTYCNCKFVTATSVLEIYSGQTISSSQPFPVNFQPPTYLLPLIVKSKNFLKGRDGVINLSRKQVFSLIILCSSPNSTNNSLRDLTSLLRFFTCQVGITAGCHEN